MSPEHDGPAPGASRPAAILLAGGTGSRLGGADKALLRRDGVTLLQAWVTALLARRLDVAVVGPPHLREHLPDRAGSQVLLAREDPPLAGPAAGAAAGVRALAAAELLPRGGHVLLLAVDTVDPEALLETLLALAPPPGRGVIPVDAEGHDQRLASMLDADALRGAVEALAPGEEVGWPLRRLVDGLAVDRPPLPAGLGRDVDTAADAAALGVEVPGAEHGRPL